MTAAASQSTNLRSQEAVIFSSVFPLKSHTVPTPEATPTIGLLASPGTPFGGFALPKTAVDEAVDFNRAWSTATRYLIASWTSAREAGEPKISKDVYRAFEYLFQDNSRTLQLIEWCVREVVVDYRQNVSSELTFWEKPVALQAATGLLSKTEEMLGQNFERRLNVFTDLHDHIRMKTKSAVMSQRLESLVGQVVQNIKNAALSSLPRQRVQNTLAFSLCQQMTSALVRDNNAENCMRRGYCCCQIQLDYSVYTSLNKVGIGGSLGERALALAVTRFLQGPAVERWCFGVDWTKQKSVMNNLRTWVERHCAPIFEETLHCFASASENTDAADLRMSQYVKTAVAGLGRLRINNLFNYIKSWPHSTGAILDIREYLASTGSAEKAYLCASFTKQVVDRLLHAGASTNEIISFYINVIYAFKILDSRGVLLEKAAIPIRAYLKFKEDTVNIVATSFLARISPTGEVSHDDPDNVCEQIAKQAADSALNQEDGKTLNWNDMQWVPEPIDAGPLYKTSKTDDVLAYILGLFSPADFIKAATAALSKQLLRTTDREMVMETKLVEFLKTRFDSTKLQSAEVMLKDMRDSAYFNKLINPTADKAKHTGVPSPREVQTAIPNEGITLNALYGKFEGRLKRSQFQAILRLVGTRRNELYFAKRYRAPAQEDAMEENVTNTAETLFDVKIISSYFWPQMRDIKSQVPEHLAELKTMYDEGFTRLSGQRKLSWVLGESTMDLKLELDDRTVVEADVPAWKATVLDAFSNQLDESTSTFRYDNATGISTAEVANRLKMEEEYVVEAINFWIAKRVIYQISPGLYAVLERLDMVAGTEADVEMTGIEDEEVPSERFENIELRKNASMFQNFIASMLRNSGSKEVGGMMGITSMLKMVMPLFTYGDDEVRSLLSEMESRGEVTKVGEMWSIAG